MARTLFRSEAHRIACAEPTWYVCGAYELTRGPTRLGSRRLRFAGGFKIAKMQLTVHCDVPGVDKARFEQLAHEAEKTCPVSNALRASVEIELVFA